MCGTVYKNATGIGKHLRQKSGAGCLGTGMKLLLEMIQGLVCDDGGGDVGGDSDGPADG